MILKDAIDRLRGRYTPGVVSNTIICVDKDAFTTVLLAAESMMPQPTWTFWSPARVAMCSTKLGETKREDDAVRIFKELCKSTGSFEVICQTDDARLKHWEDQRRGR